MFDDLGRTAGREAIRFESEIYKHAERQANDTLQEIQNNAIAAVQNVHGRLTQSAGDMRKMTESLIGSVAQSLQTHLVVFWESLTKGNETHPLFQWDAQCQCDGGPWVCMSILPRLGGPYPLNTIYDVNDNLALSFLSQQIHLAAVFHCCLYSSITEWSVKSWMLSTQSAINSTLKLFSHTVHLLTVHLGLRWNTEAKTVDQCYWEVGLHLEQSISVWEKNFAAKGTLAVEATKCSAILHSFLSLAQQLWA